MKTTVFALTLLASAELFSTIQCRDEFPVCNIPCCEVFPNCANAVTLKCACEDQRMVALSKGDVPESVEEIDISGTSRMVIHQDAIYDLSSLAFMRITSFDRVYVQRNGLKLNPKSRLLSIEAMNITTLDIHTSAITGQWNDILDVKISNINTLKIRPNAFQKSAEKGIRLNLAQIEYLNLSPGGFSSPINKLTMHNVSMPLCENGSFTGNIQRIDFRNVSITEAKTGCVTASDNLKSLHFQSCKLDVVQTLAISGSLRDVKIERTNITTVQEQAFKVYVSDFQISGSQIRNLAAMGFAVTATNSIRLTNIKVTRLQKQALFGLHMNSEENYKKEIIVRDFYVLHAENNSLQFTKNTKLDVYNLDVHFPSPPICPVERWVIQLTGTKAEPLNLAGRQLLKKLKFKTPVICEIQPEYYRAPTVKNAISFKKVIFLAFIFCLCISSSVILVAVGMKKGWFRKQSKNEPIHFEIISTDQGTSNSEQVRKRKVSKYKP